MNRIFVSIASYRDPLLLQTIREAIRNADAPKNLIFGIVEQELEDRRLTLSKVTSQNIRYIGVDPKDSRGACWARSMAMSMYQGEDWFFQIDSHMLFEASWDTHYIRNIAHCYQRSSKPMLTGYPSSFTMVDGRPVKGPFHTGTTTTTVNKEIGFGETGHLLTMLAHENGRESASPAMHISGANVFASGRIVEEVPYDPQLYFMGEEQSFSLRAYTHGWDMWHTPGMMLYHLYAAEENRDIRVQHWEETVDTQRLQPWKTLDDHSQNRLSEIVTGKLSGAYGLGKARSLNDFKEFSGIDYVNKTLSPKAFGESE